MNDNERCKRIDFELQGGNTETYWQGVRDYREGRTAEGDEPLEYWFGRLNCAAFADGAQQAKRIELTEQVCRLVQLRALARERRTPDPLALDAAGAAWYAGFDAGHGA